MRWYPDIAVTDEQKLEFLWSQLEGAQTAMRIKVAKEKTSFEEREDHYSKRIAAHVMNAKGLEARCGELAEKLTKYESRRTVLHAVKAELKKKDWGSEH